MQIRDIITLTNHKGLAHGSAKLRDRGLGDIVLYCLDHAGYRGLKASGLISTTAVKYTFTYLLRGCKLNNQQRTNC
jgi:hypothetical protein